MRPIEFINSIDELRYEKELLRKKVKKQQKKIEKHYKEIKQDATPSKILDETLEKFGVESELLPILLPLALKYRSSIFDNKIVNALSKMSKRKLAIGALAGVSIGLAGYLIATTERHSLPPVIIEDDSTDDRQMFI